MSDAVTPAPIAVPQADLDDLADRLARTRWPEVETVGGWRQGVPLAAAQALVAHWRERYDWRRCEAMLNGWHPQRTVIDGLGIHFFHIRSPEPDALPLVMTHGWPGSPIEFHKVIGPLTNPRAHGLGPAQAFHLVLPSLPGYGFSDKPTKAGWGVETIAEAWATLMRRLGYGGRWAAQGGDWGAAVTMAIGALAPAGCIGVHANVCMITPTAEEKADADERERAILARARQYAHELSAYARQQASRPQTTGYLLADSPVAQAMWIYERFLDWTDHDGTPESVLTRDEMLDNIMLYWLGNAGASSARLYWESFARLVDRDPVPLPLALSIFPKDISSASERWARRRYPSIVYWNELPRGGHFAAFEQPALFVDEVRAAFAAIA